MDSNKTLARRAGWIYFLQGLLAPFAYFYVPSALIVPNDAVATADRIRASDGLLRAAVAAELFTATAVIFAILALYRLFENVDKRMAVLMAALFLFSIPISYMNALNNLAPIILTRNAAVLASLDGNQVGALVMLFLRLHNYGLAAAQIFWGIWMIPYGILILRCDFIPRWLAYPLFVAAAGYVLNSVGTLFLPSIRGISSYGQILGLGELPIIIWLIVWGARPTRTPGLGESGA